MSGSNSRTQYVEEYYKKNYDGSLPDNEIEVVGKFLIEHTVGRVLDCGCGPVPQIWTIFMPEMTAYYAIDLPSESIDFVKGKIRTFRDWQHEFTDYVKFVKETYGEIEDTYLEQQIRKIVSVQQADMSKALPFANNFFDTALSLYSLGVLASIEELENAIMNIAEKLKPGGRLLHINTNGHNRNDILPEYTWRGLEQTTDSIEQCLKRNGFEEIQIEWKKLEQVENGSMYKYDMICLLKATKMVDFLPKEESL